MKRELWFSLNFIGQIGFATAIPLVVFAFFGRWLDKHFGGNHHYFLITGLILATIIVYFALKKLVKDAIKQFNIINKN